MAEKKGGEVKEVKLEEVVQAVGVLAESVKTLQKRLEQLEKKLSAATVKQKEEFDLDINSEGVQGQNIPMTGQDLIGMFLLKKLSEEDAAKAYEEAYRHFQNVYMTGFGHAIKLMGTLAKFMSKKKGGDIEPEKLEEAAIELAEVIEEAVVGGRKKKGNKNS